MNTFVFLCVSDRTPTRLQFTQEVAEGTLNRSAEVLQMMTPILKRVEEWDSNMKNEVYSAAAFDRTVLSAGEAGMVALLTSTQLSSSTI